MVAKRLDIVLQDLASFRMRTYKIQDKKKYTLIYWFQKDLNIVRQTRATKKKVLLYPVGRDSQVNIISRRKLIYFASFDKLL